jgi:acetyl esterase
MEYRIDPELDPIVGMLPKPSEDLAVTRANMAQLFEVLNSTVDPSSLTIEDRIISGPLGAPAIPIRIYRPEGQCPAVILHIHGGGFVLGSLESEHPHAVALAREVGALVVSIDYRLAPENPFPAAPEDCYAALLWVQANAKSLEIEPNRIAVLGNSCGGGIATAVALMARDRNTPAPCSLFLNSPELDDRLETTSMKRFVDTPLFSRPQAERSWRAYLGDKREPVSPYAAPARASDLSGLPATYIAAAEFDPLRDEAVIFGLRLLEAGVTVELHTFPGTFHGSSAFAFAAVSRRQADELRGVLKRALQLT